MVYGRVESYDNNKGTGLITPESGGKGLPFDSSAFSWADKIAPAVGRRLSYECVENAGVNSAIKLQHA
jgi:cold shock CspA family protein